MNAAELSKAGQEKLKACFLENQHLQKIVGLRTVSDLNKAVQAGYATQIINGTEALQERKIIRVVDSIEQRGCRLILLAGGARRND